MPQTRASSLDYRGCATARDSARTSTGGPRERSSLRLQGIQGIQPPPGSQGHSRTCAGKSPLHRIYTPIPNGVSTMSGSRIRTRRLTARLDSPLAATRGDLPMRIVRVLVPAFVFLFGLSSTLTAYAGSLVRLSSDLHQLKSASIGLRSSPTLSRLARRSCPLSRSAASSTAAPPISVSPPRPTAARRLAAHS